VSQENESQPEVSPNEQTPQHRYLALLACNALVFIASVCIMALELTGARLIAKNVGSSLYTWTSVIGIVLAGITCGNYIGGWLADRTNTRRLLAWLFFLSSLSCFSILWLDQLMLDWHRPADMSWPLWIVAIVASLFFLPSTLLGAISPAVASMALSMHLRTGITLGNVYAWGALGSIVGTFLTGFILIDILGIRAIVTLIALTLALMGVLVAVQQRVFRIAVMFGWVQFVIVIGLLASATGNNMAQFADLFYDKAATKTESDEQWSARELLTHWFKSFGNAAHELGLILALRDDSTEEYNDESNYSTIIVGDDNWGGAEMVRFLRIDKLVHAYYNPSRPDKLYYDYENIYAEVVNRIVEQWQAEGLVTQDNDKPVVDNFFLGGGGYVFPRWMERRFAPSSVVEVAEIDPAVTEAVRKELGLPPSDQTRIVNIVGDARNVLDDRLRKNSLAKSTGGAPVLYDFAFGDAFNDFSIPWHLVTAEFNRKIQSALKAHGIYLVNIIDRYPRTEVKAADMPLPAELSPDEIGEYWQAAPAPFEAIEVKAEDDTLWLAVRGAMPLNLRDKLLALAPEQKAFAAVVQELFRRSAAEKSGRFLARFVNTLRDSFGNIYVYSTAPDLPNPDRDTLVIVASPKPLPQLFNARLSMLWPGEPFAVLETGREKPRINSRMATLLEQSQGRLLTDDYAPVDNLLLPIVADQD